MSQFEQLLTTEPYREIRPVATTWYEQGEQSGSKAGKGTGQREFLEMLLEKRFRKLAPEEQQALSAQSSDELIALGVKLLNAVSIEELGLLNGSRH